MKYLVMEGGSEVSRYGGGGVKYLVAYMANRNIVLKVVNKLRLKVYRL